MWSHWRQINRGLSIKKGNRRQKEEKKVKERTPFIGKRKRRRKRRKKRSLYSCTAGSPPLIIIFERDVFPHIQGTWTMANDTGDTRHMGLSFFFFFFPMGWMGRSIHVMYLSCTYHVLVMYLIYTDSILITPIITPIITYKFNTYRMGGEAKGITEQR
ncbi:hypothetical protein BDF14DRAFT_587160 [Spinellus fusiger]|nr:hypothetical protein BDF14DRAFT_587160 [Spinellus fusiger]